MIRTLPWTWGTTGGQGGAVGPEWVWPHNARAMRAYPPRVRGTVWVEWGHTESDDPALDTEDA